MRKLIIEIEDIEDTNFVKESVSIMTLVVNALDGYTLKDIYFDKKPSVTYRGESSNRS